MRRGAPVLAASQPSSPSSYTAACGARASRPIWPSMSVCRGARLQMDPGGGSPQPGPPPPQPQPQWSLPPSLHAFVPQRRNRDRLVRLLLRPYDPVTRTLCGFALLFWFNRAQHLPARLEGGARREEERGQAPEEERVDPTQQDVEGLRNSREYILSDISDALSLVKLLEEDDPNIPILDVPCDTPFEVAVTIKNLILHKVVQDITWGTNIIDIIGDGKCDESQSRQDQRGRR